MERSNRAQWLELRLFDTNVTKWYNGVVLFGLVRHREGPARDPRKSLYVSLQSWCRGKSAHLDNPRVGGTQCFVDCSATNGGSSMQWTRVGGELIHH